MSTSEASPVRLSAWVDGDVQGVGFRWWTRRQALALGLAGSAENLADGRVAVVAEGSRPACESLLAALRSAAAPGRVVAVEQRWDHAAGLVGFQAR